VTVGECLFEFDWRAVVERFVQACVVEPADPLDDRELELGAGLPDAVGDELGLEGINERLGEGVVVGVADRSDRAEHAMVVEYLPEGIAGVFESRRRSDG
jgi:hypothetical protein